MKDRGGHLGEHGGGEIGSKKEEGGAEVPVLKEKKKRGVGEETPRKKPQWGENIN